MGGRFVFVFPSALYRRAIAAIFTTPSKLPPHRSFHSPRGQTPARDGFGAAIPVWRDFASCGACRRTRAWTRGTEAICASDMMFASPTCRCGRGHAAISNSRLRRALHDGSSKWKRESLAQPAIARRCDRPAGARAHRSAKKRDARGDPSKRSRASLLPHREQRARDHNLPTDAFTS